MVKEYSLYVHIPFCSKKCEYCHFFVLPNQEFFKDPLLKGLKKEWELSQPKTNSTPPHTIYFGGGTPSLFGPERIHELLSLWGGSDIEISLEANPESVTEELMRKFAKAGINRISLGVQSFDDGLLQVLSRTHNAQTAIRAIHTISKIIPNISIDLMYDIPGQTMEHWEKTLSLAVDLPIRHISLYNLTFEPHTVYYKYRSRLKPKVPDEATSLAMYEIAVQKLTENHFLQYEISAFSRPGFESQHNRGYWEGRPFLGLGPSAYGYWNGSRMRNVAHYGKYLRALEEGKLPIDFQETLEDDAAERELFVIGIRMLKGMDTRKYPSVDREVIREFIKQGLLEQSGDCVRLTHLGVLHYDTIAAELI